MVGLDVMQASKLIKCEQMLDTKFLREIQMPFGKLTCNENSYKEGNSCATAPTASSAMLMQSANDRDTMRGVRHDHRPASVTSLHPASSSSNSDYAERNIKHKTYHTYK